MPEDPPRKRSRFDQTEAEPRKGSRFDRRSRSPTSRTSETRRSRSPLTRSESVSSPAVKSDAKPEGVEEKAKPKLPSDPAAIAAAAAAKINAQLAARKNQIDTSGIKSPSTSTSTSALKSSTSNAGTSVGKIDGDIYVADGDYIKDIEVNDLRNKFTLTKGSIQKMIKDETGADVTTRGEYYPNKALATAAKPPLHLHVTSTTREGLDAAIKKIEELMAQELPNLIDERRFRKREPDFERDELGRRKWPEAKIPILMTNLPGFNLRAQIVGQGGTYVKHIQNETRCRVQIKGKGSGFMEHTSGIESEEPMYLHIASPDAEQVARAKQLCQDLLESVQRNYEHFKANPPASRPETYTDGYGADANRSGYRIRGPPRDDRYNGNGGGYGQQNPQNHNAYNSNGYAASATPTTPHSGTETAASLNPDAQAYADQWAAYYAQNPNADPYAAYGGIEAYTQAYYQYYGQPQPGTDPSQAQGYDPTQAYGTAVQGQHGAPPPPPDNNAPPPPPSGYQGEYSAVPPPPGM